jgi:arginase
VSDLVPRRLRLISVPYGSGRRGDGLGAGPAALVAAGAGTVAARGGALVDEVVVACEPLPVGEVPAYFEVPRHVRDEVARAVDDGAAPVVLAGSCGATLGVVAGLSPARLGVLWLDAHADLNDPDTTTSGYLDGMCLSMLTGRSWRALTSAATGSGPVADEAVLLVGGHSLEPAEQRILEQSRICVVTPDAVTGDPGRVAEAISRLAAGVDAIHVHVDLDVHDESVGRANAWAAPGGLEAAQVRTVIEAAAAQAPLSSATIASWDPQLDHDGRMTQVGLELVETIGRAMTRTAT